VYAVHQLRDGFFVFHPGSEQALRPGVSICIEALDRMGEPRLGSADAGQKIRPCVRQYQRYAGTRGSFDYGANLSFCKLRSASESGLSSIVSSRFIPTARLYHLSRCFGDFLGFRTVPSLHIGGHRNANSRGNAVHDRQHFTAGIFCPSGYPRALAIPALVVPIAGNSCFLKNRGAGHIPSVGKQQSLAHIVQCKKLPGEFSLRCPGHSKD